MTLNEGWGAFLSHCKHTKSIHLLNQLSYQCLTSCRTLALPAVASLSIQILHGELPSTAEGSAFTMNSMVMSFIIYSTLHLLLAWHHWWWYYTNWRNFICDGDKHTKKILSVNQNSSVIHAYGVLPSQKQNDLTTRTESYKPKNTDSETKTQFWEAWANKLSWICRFHLSPKLRPSIAEGSPPSMPSNVLYLLLSCSRLFPPSLLCTLAIFYLVGPLTSSLSVVATLCSV